MLVLCALAVLSVLQHAVVDYALRMTSGKEALVLELDKQRLALKRSLLVAYAYRNDNRRSGLSEIADAEESFQQAYGRLMDQAGMAELPPALREQLVASKPLYDEYFRNLRAKASDWDQPLPRVSDALELLDSLTAVVATYEAEAGQGYRLVNRLVWPSALVHVACFALLAVFAYRGAIASDQKQQRSLYLKATEYEQIYDESPFLQYEVDGTGIIRRVNHTFAETVGYPPGELIGTSIFEYLVGGDEIRREFDSSDFKEAVASFDRELIRTDSLAVPVTLFAVRSARVGGRDVIEVTGIDRSSERNAKIAANAAQTSRENSFAVAPIPMFAAAADGRIIDANPCLLETLGVESVEEVNELDIRGVVAVATQRKRDRAGTSFKSQQTLHTKTNGRLDVILHVWSFDTAGERGTEGVFIDVSAYEKTRRDLHSSRNRFQRLYDQTPVMLCSLDSAGRLSECNDSMTRRFEPLAGNLIGRALEELVVSDERDFFVAQVDSCKTTRSVVEFDAALVLNDGEHMQVRVFVSPRVARGRAVGGLLVTMLDTATQDTALPDADDAESSVGVAD